MSISATVEIHFEHRVYFTQAVFNPANPLLTDVLSDRAQQAKALVLVDGSLAGAQPKLVGQIEAYFAAHSQRLLLTSRPLVLAGGEQVKNGWTELSHIYDQIERNHLDRHSYVIAVGGGALLDVVGFAAATAHRGIRHIRIPTTTLGQNDSGVGIKSGINAFGKKNFIGAFALPFAVINDFELLASLSERDKRAGCAEAVKVAAIRDAQFFAQLEEEAPQLRRFEPKAARSMIFRCAQLHINHIAKGGDPFELHSGRPLDFGHWSAHKLEALSSYRLRHGEAVAIGIAIDTIYSRNIGWLDDASAQRVLDLLEALGFELFTPELLRRDAAGQRLVLRGLQEFGEHLGGALTLTLLQGIGKGVETSDISLPGMALAIDALEQRASQRAPLRT